ncbi:major facilitator superfamily domain-containing protein [Syncephalis plumigaleata]|nr:major facilitator superfamily domain-containing protein [Syncephalis plumigaleata]
MINEIIPAPPLDQLNLSLTKSFESIQERTDTPSKPNPLIRFTLWYFGNTRSVRTGKQIEQDRTILGYAFKRWLILIAIFLTQFSMGSTFAWAVFNQPVDGYIYGNVHEGMSPLALSIMLCFSGLGVLSISPILERHGPRPILIAGTIIFVTGHLVTAAGVYFKYIALVYVGFSVLAGIATGFCYIVSVTVVQKWYPSHKGAASGFAVACFGIGTMAYAKIALLFMKTWSVPFTLIAYAIVHFVFMSIGTFIMRAPPPDFMSNNGSSVNVVLDDGTIVRTPTRIVYTLIDTLLNREYRLLYWIYLSSSMFSLSMMSRLPNTIVDIFNKIKILHRPLFQCNWSSFLCMDIRYNWTQDDICGLFTLEIACITLMIIFIHTGSFWPFVVSSWFTTACFGGSLSLTPPTVAELFGIRNVSTGFGIMFMGWGVTGTLGGIIVTEIYNYLVDVKQYATSDPFIYTINYYWLLVICCTGMISLWFLRMTVRDRLFPPVPGQCLLIRVGDRLLRVSTSRYVEWLSPEEQNIEWTTFWSTQNVPESGCIPAPVVKQVVDMARNNYSSKV